MRHARLAALSLWDHSRGSMHQRAETVFANADERIAVVFTNTSDREQLVQLWVAGQPLKFSCPAGGVMTLTL